MLFPSPDTPDLRNFKGQRENFLTLELLAALIYKLCYE